MLTIDIVDNGIILNKTLVQFPMTINALTAILNEPIWNQNMARYIWNDLGIYARSADKINVELITICFMIEDEEDLPTLPFDGTLSINGKDFKENELIVNYTSDEYEFLEKTVGFLLVSGTKKNNKLVDITIFETEKISIVPEPELDPKKYTLKKTKGKKIKFYDFNFKLAIIQELMYKKELLLPKFDINEFVTLYTKRNIDLNSEGEDIIPEIKKYFEDLEISIELADDVNEINQLENDIYLNIIPFWDGEDDVFNIKSIKGIEQFKNLKQATLFFDNDETILNEFKKSGVTAKWL